MKTRRTRSSGGTDDGEEGDPSLIAFRRLRTSTDHPLAASSNASAASGGDSKKKSPSSQPTSRRPSRFSGGDDDDNEDSNVKSAASTGAAAPRRSTRTSNSVGGDAEDSPSAAANSTKEKSSKTQLPSFKTQGNSSAASKSKEPANGDQKNQQEEAIENGKDATFFQEEDDNRKPAARTKEEMNNDEEENYYEESQHHRPPVKEITTTTTRHHRSSGAATKKKQRGDGPKYLEDNTLKLVHDYVEEFKGDPLDEDDVVGFMSRVQKTANEQAKYQMQFVTGRAARHPDSDRESDYNSDDTSVFQDCLGEEEEHAIGHDMFKKVVANIQIEHSRKSGNASKSGSLTNKLLDKKTLMWIKRAAGLHRNDPGKMLMQKNSDGKGGRMSTRRFTRKQALDRRGQKKKERGLDFLGTAVNQLEPEYGPFLERRIKRKKKKNRRFVEEEEVVDRKRKKDKGTSVDEPNKRKKKKSTRDDEVRWSRTRLLHGCFRPSLLCLYIQK